VSCAGRAVSDDGGQSYLVLEPEFFKLGNSAPAAGEICLEPGPGRSCSHK
jgi:hypothetical protein